MSGIFGYASLKPHPNRRDWLHNMQYAFPQETPTACQQWTSPTCDAGLAIEYPTRLSHKQSGHIAANETLVCLVDGIVYQDSVNGRPELADPQPANRLLKQYEAHGIDGLRNISGSFVVAWWHKQEQKLVLANDKVGYRQLFYAQDGNHFFFSSFLTRLPGMLTRTPQIDPEAFADLLAYRNIFDSRTLLKEIKVLPGGSAITFANGQVRTHPYWHYTEIEAYGQYDTERLDQLTVSLQLAVKRAFQPGKTAVLTLTGGIDSRVILAAAANQQINFATLTDGNPHSSDANIAAALAEHVNVPHYCQPVYTHQLSSMLLSMIQHQSGLIPTIHAHPCQYLQSPLPFEVIVSGITGETARSPWLSPSDLPHSNLPYATQVLAQAIASPLAKKIDLGKLWQAEWQHLGANAPQQHLDALLSSYNYPHSPLMAADYYGFDIHTRKFLNKGSTIALGNMDIALPYIDHEWISAIMSVPLADRVTNQIQLDLIKRLYPSLMSLPYEKTMLPLNAAKWQADLYQKYRHYRSKISQRWGNGRFQNHIPAYNYSSWSRREMRSLLEPLLLNKQAAYRAYLDTDLVPDLLRKHFSGQQNWPHLVAALTTFELAHDLWIDNWHQKPSAKRTIAPQASTAFEHLPIAS